MKNPERRMFFILQGSPERLKSFIVLFLETRLHVCLLYRKIIDYFVVADVVERC